MRDTGTFTVKAGLAEMLKGGVIMDVVTAEHARIAEAAGAAAVMALERVPADIRVDGGVARMSDPDQDRGDPAGRDHPGDGQGADRPLRGGPGARGARGRLHRRVRGADAGRRGAPHRQVALQGAVRLRGDQARRGAAPDRRGRRHDPQQGRGRHRQRGRGRAPHARDRRRDPPTRVARRVRAAHAPPRSSRRRSTWFATWPRRGGCPSCCSPPGAWPPRRTPR